MAVEVELNPNARQSDLAAALEPVVARILHRYKAAQEQLKTAKARNEGKAAEEAQNELNALVLFKADLGAFQRIYAFLSQIFDYGNTAIEKRYWFFKRLLPLLEFGREREEIDLSKVVLTHHHLKISASAPCHWAKVASIPNSTHSVRPAAAWCNKKRKACCTRLSPG